MIPDTMSTNIYVGLPEDIEKRMAEDVAKKVTEYQTLEFGAHRKEIAKLSLQEKLAWYAMQNPQVIISLGNNAEFRRFWLYRVVIPMRIKRLFYRIKNGEVFKKYNHITDMKKARKGPHRI